MTYENLTQFVELLRAIQVKDDNDVIIGVTGRRGSGKSSFAIQVARRYVEKYFGETNFDVKRYIAYNNEDVMEKIHTLPKYSPLIGDEAVRFAWSREWNKTDNKELAKLTTQIRTKKFIFFMNIPKLAWIDSVYREGMLDIWIWVHATFTSEGKKSYSLMFEPDDNQGEGDSWHMSLLREGKKKKRRRIGRFTDIEKVIKLINHHPCFVDSFVFPKVPTDIYERYLKVRNERAFERTNEFISQKDAAKIIIHNFKNQWLKIQEVVGEARAKLPTNKIISDILSYDHTRKKITLPQDTVRTWINEINKLVPQVQEEPKVEGKQDNETEQSKEITSPQSNLGIVKSAIAVSKQQASDTPSDD